MKKNKKKILEKKILSIKNWRNPFIINGKKLKLNDNFNREWLHDFQIYKSLILNRIIKTAVKLNSPKSIKKKSLLEIGSGEGYLSHNHLKLGLKSITGYELRKESVYRANLIKNYYGSKKIKYINKNIEIIKDSKKFDIVTANGLLYHLSDIISVMEKISKLTNDILVISMFKHVDFSLTKLGFPDLSFTKTSTMRLNVEDEKLVGSGYKPLVFVPSEKSIIKLLKNTNFKTVIRLYPYPKFRTNYINYSNFAFYVAFKKKLNINFDQNQNLQVKRNFNFFSKKDQFIVL